MTWNAKQRRWFKRREGKQHVVSCKALSSCHPELYQAETKEGSYRAANQWWELKLRSIDLTYRIEKSVDPADLGIVADALVTGDMKTFLNSLPSELVADILRAHGEDDLAVTFDLTAVGEQTLADADKTLATVNDFVNSYSSRRPHTHSAKIADTIRRFTDGKIGDVSPGQYHNLTKQLDTFQEWIGNETLADINELRLTDYRNHLKGRADDKQISRKYASEMLKSCKQFVRWAVEHNMMRRPANLDSKTSLRITVPKKAVVIPAMADLAAMLDGCQDRTRLFVLLALNCGMYQSDIGNLRRDEVDWDAGTITRKRTKTAGCENVPIVTYKLWPETLNLLRRFASEEGEYILTTKEGKPIYRDNIVGGKRKKVDLISRAYNYVDTNISFKMLRKTSASLMADDQRFASVASQFLGHAPATMAEVHYLAATDNLLGEALDWLRGQYKAVGVL